MNWDSHKNQDEDAFMENADSLSENDEEEVKEREMEFW